MSAPRVTGCQEITGFQELPVSLRAVSGAVFINPNLSLPLCVSIRVKVPILGKGSPPPGWDLPLHTPFTATTRVGSPQGRCLPLLQCRCSWPPKRGKGPKPIS